MPTPSWWKAERPSTLRTLLFARPVSRMRLPSNTSRLTGCPLSSRLVTVGARYSTKVSDPGTAQSKQISVMQPNVVASASRRSRDTRYEGRETNSARSLASCRVRLFRGTQLAYRKLALSGRVGDPAFVDDEEGGGQGRLRGGPRPARGGPGAGGGGGSAGSGAAFARRSPARFGFV